jgi:hypothetical protein
MFRNYSETVTRSSYICGAFKLNTFFYRFILQNSTLLTEALGKQMLDHIEVHHVSIPRNTQVSTNTYALGITTTIIISEELSTHHVRRTITKKQKYDT